VIFILLVDLGVGAILTTNVILDKSPSVVSQALVLEKFTRTRKGRSSYFLHVKSPDQAILPFQGRVEIRVSGDEYHRVVPQLTSLDLLLKPGFWKIRILEGYSLRGE
jgi:hypothetical protein